MISNLTSKQIIRNFNLYLLMDIEMEEDIQKLFDTIKHMLENSTVDYKDKGTAQEVVMYSDENCIFYMKYHKSAGYLWIHRGHIIDYYKYLKNIERFVLKDILKWYIDVFKI